ncbi:MAG: tripartite tricarboxylate transporter TctB family protein [Deltaproteobacteria bacterium]|nr:tripartite tricarboxylate transporter TctB family protein [Deltaproteobacteria bacterium]
MRKKITYDQLIGVILLVFSAALYFLIIPHGIEHGRTGTGLDPAFMPDLIAVILAILSLLLILSRYVTRGSKASLGNVRFFPLRTMITIALFITYITITPMVGYLPATGIILLTYLLFFGARKWVTIVMVTVTLPLILYWFFAKVMLVMLPTGILFG